MQHLCHTGVSVALGYSLHCAGMVDRELHAAPQWAVRRRLSLPSNPVKFTSEWESIRIMNFWHGVFCFVLSSALGIVQAAFKANDVPF
jgi:hypothetical protein